MNHNSQHALYIFDSRRRTEPFVWKPDDTVALIQSVFASLKELAHKPNLFVNLNALNAFYVFVMYVNSLSFVWESD